MSNKVFCPVCLVSFIIKEPLKERDTVLCPVCGAKLEITATSPEVTARRLPQRPEVEIRERVDNFARLKGYVFNEDKESVIETKQTATSTVPANMTTSLKISAPAWKHAVTGSSRKECASEAFFTKRGKVLPRQHLLTRNRPRGRF
jgi:hypothetical protein